MKRSDERNEGWAVRGETRACPTCGKEVGEASETFPFCSRRCRDVDLGNWFSGAYKVSREIKDRDLDAME